MSPGFDLRGSHETLPRLSFHYLAEYVIAQHQGRVHQCVGTLLEIARRFRQHKCLPEVDGASYERARDRALRLVGRALDLHDTVDRFEKILHVVSGAAAVDVTRSLE